MANVNNFDPVAWSIDGGRHGGELLRVLGYAATGGGEGVISAGDCKVRQLDTPGAGVAIDAGAVAFRNRSANVRNQTYVANSRATSTLDITSTGAGVSRSDLICVRAEDPQYSPWTQPPAADAPSFQYVKPFVIPNVPANTRTFRELNLGYSGYALARVDLPPSTSTVTDARIVNLRQLVNPFRHSLLFRFNVTAEHSLPADDSYVTWPNWEPSMLIPERATHLTAFLTAFGVLKPIGGDVIGNMDLQIGQSGGAFSTFGSIVFEEEPNPGAEQWRRTALGVSGETNVVALRGLTRSIRTIARRHIQNSAPDGTLRLMPSTQFMLTVNFEERAI